jgi:hypothetical protein
MLQDKNEKASCILYPADDDSVGGIDQILVDFSVCYC